MAPLPRSSRRNRLPSRNSLSSRELLADPIDMSDDDPSYTPSLPPQSHVQSIDDAPPPTSHLPSVRIFPLPTINLNRDTDDEQPAPTSPDPHIPDSVLEHFPRRLNPTNRFIKKRSTKSRPFAGVDSLLRHASARQAQPNTPANPDAVSSAPASSHQSALSHRHHRLQNKPHPKPPRRSRSARLARLPPNYHLQRSDDDLDDDYILPTLPTRRSTRNSHSASSPPQPIDKPRFDLLLRAESNPKEKARFRKLFRSASGKVTLAQIAEVLLSAKHREAQSSLDDIPVPRKSRRLNNPTAAPRKPPSEAASDHSYDHIEVMEEVEEEEEEKEEKEEKEHEEEVEEEEEEEGEEEQDEEEEEEEIIKPRRRGTRAQSKGRGRKGKNQASVPLPKRQNTLAHRVKARVAKGVHATRPSKSRAGKSKVSKKKTGKKDTKKRKTDSDTKRKTAAGVRRSQRTAVRRKAKRDDWESEPEEDDSDFLSELEDDDQVVTMDEDSGDESGGDADSDEEELANLRTWKGKKKRRVNKRRKRTRPADAFKCGKDELSAQEQKERLDFLLKQSADISRMLHKAMAEAATNNQTLPAGAKSPLKQKVAGDADGVDEAEGPNGAAADAAENPADSNDGGPQSRKEEELVPPTGKGTELQLHQIDGVKWLLTLDGQGLNAILADEMGLGKTIQAITFLASLVISGSRGPHLVIAPKNVCDHWAREVRLFYPGKINVVTHIGSCEERFEELGPILDEDNFDILVTSYEVALRDLLQKKIEGGMRPYRKVIRKFRSVEFEYLIVDEAHRLKNDNSKLNMGIRSYQQAQRRLLLTGTPLSNDLKELWSLMNVLNPTIFSSKATFEEWFAAPFEPRQGSRSAKNRLSHAEQSVIVDRLHTVIRPFFRRRVRADVCPSYTSADEVVVRCAMSQLQRALMLHFRKRADSRDSFSVNNIIMSMRMLSSHPFTLSPAMYNPSDKQAHARLVASSGKFEFLHYSLPRLLAAGHRVLIFSQFRRTLDFLEDLMEFLGVKYGRLDGQSAARDRLETISDFNSPQSKLKVFLLTTRAGGVGINLQTADTVILFDSDWNPSADLQAVSRIQRIGQQRTVHIIRLLTEKSADMHIYDKQRQKLRTQAVAVGAGKFNSSSGFAMDQNVRQKDLEKVLEDLDINNYLEEDVVYSTPVEEQGPGTSKTENPAAVQSATNPASGAVAEEKTPSASAHVTSIALQTQESISNGNTLKVIPEKLTPKGPDSSAPSQQTLDARAARAKEWDQQLLRPGEESLPNVAHETIWVDSVGENGSVKIPIWLRNDANLQAASRAIDSRDPSTADYVYEETLQSIMRKGAFSKKERAQRARRNVIQDFGSEFGSESEDGESSSGDPNAEIPSMEDISDAEEYSASEQGNATPRKKKKLGGAKCEASSGDQKLPASTAVPGAINFPSNSMTHGSTAVPASSNTGRAYISPFSSHAPAAPHPIHVMPQGVPIGDARLNPGQYAYWQQLAMRGLLPAAQAPPTQPIFRVNPSNSHGVLMPASSSAGARKDSFQPSPTFQTMQMGSSVRAVAPVMRVMQSPSIGQPVLKPLSTPTTAYQQNISSGSTQFKNEVPTRNLTAANGIGELTGSSPASYSMVSGAAPQTLILQTQSQSQGSQHPALGMIPPASPLHSRMMASSLQYNLKQFPISPEGNAGHATLSKQEAVPGTLLRSGSPAEKTKESAGGDQPSSSAVHSPGKKSVSEPVAKEYTILVQDKSPSLTEGPRLPNPNGKSLKTAGKQAHPNATILHPSSGLDDVVTRGDSAALVKQAALLSPAQLVPLNFGAHEETRTDNDNKINHNLGIADEGATMKTSSPPLRSPQDALTPTAVEDIGEREKTAQLPKIESSSKQVMGSKLSSSTAFSATCVDLDDADVRRRNSASVRQPKSAPAEGAPSAKKSLRPVGPASSERNSIGYKLGLSNRTKSGHVSARDGNNQKVFKANRVSTAESGPSAGRGKLGSGDQARAEPAKTSSRTVATSGGKKSSEVIDLTDATDSESENSGDCMVAEPMNPGKAARPAFSSLVQQLRGITKVQDTDTLIDVLLASNWNVKAAAEVIKSRT